MYKNLITVLSIGIMVVMVNVWKCLFSIMALIIAVTLLCSFALHSFQITHVHHEHHNRTGEHEPAGLVLGEYMHATDKKLFLIVAAATLFAFAALTGFYRNWNYLIIKIQYYYRTLLYVIERLSLRIIYYLEQCFSLGLLHPKLH